jgi:hypothetical protein
MIHVLGSTTHDPLHDSHVHTVFVQQLELADAKTQHEGSSVHEELGSTKYNPSHA